MNKPAIWEIVLTQFEEKQYFQNGLTLPFLMGTHMYFGDKNPKLQVSSFLSEMTSNQNLVSILFCDTIREYVFSWLDKESIHSLKTNKIALQKIGNLVDSDGSVLDFNDKETMRLFFEGRYQNLVENQLFSKNRGIWGGYSDIDIMQLESIRANL